MNKLGVAIFFLIWESRFFQEYENALFPELLIQLATKVTKDRIHGFHSTSATEENL